MGSNKRSKGSVWDAAWSARAGGRMSALLAVALDPHATSDDLAVLVPPFGQLAGLPSSVAVAVLRHPRCPEGLAARLAGHPDPAVRLEVLRRVNVGTMAAALLLGDNDPEVRAVARRILGE